MNNPVQTKWQQALERVPDAKRAELVARLSGQLRTQPRCEEQYASAAAAVSASGVVVPLQAEGNRQPFFCVHPGGGGVLCYRALSKALGGDQPFLGIQAPGYDGEQKPLEHLVEMAACYVQALRARQPRGPYAIGGWSFGGVVAFEMARQLLAAGEDVNFLALLDAAIHADIRLADRPDEIILAIFLTDLGLPLDRVADAKEELLPLPAGERMARALELLKTRGVLPDHVSLERMRAMAGMFVRNVRSMKGYVPAPLPIAATVFRATQQVPLLADDRTLGWEGLFQKGLDVVEIEGNHYTMFRVPEVFRLAAALREAMDRGASNA